jgi:hypothetical protein
VAGDASKPVGSGDYIVSDGECMASIAEGTGHFWQKLWDLSDNREVKDARKDPNVLLKGDRLVVPPLESKDVDAPTEQHHKFKRKGVPSVLHLVLMELGEPLSNQPYRLVIDMDIRTGTTTRKGEITEKVPPGARSAKLFVGPADKQREYTLDLGGLDPVTTLKGQKQRLNTLGYGAGVEDNQPGEEFAAALARFQHEHDLELKEELDDAARDKLEKLYRQGGA